MTTSSLGNKPSPVENSNLMIFSNVRVLYAIAKESYAEMKADEKKRVRPKPNGEKGNIIIFDPAQNGFKCALITVVFCGVCLDALLHLLIVKKLGIGVWEKLDKKSFKEKTYEKKLNLLGCTDQGILNKCEQFRTCRNEIVHEKAYFDKGKIRFGQNEAKKSIELVDSICRFFQVNLD